MKVRPCKKKCDNVAIKKDMVKLWYLSNPKHKQRQG
jgi:ribosomal protein L36